MRARAVVVSVSGGKDSTATALLALDEIERGADVRFVFADTGNEHALTYEYVTDYMPARLGLPVHIVRADFSERIAGKRRYVAETWPTKGMSAADVERALAVLQPTGVPFLDLCLWKGRFPSRMVQFCTQELKRYPLDEYMFEALEGGFAVESWQGVRRDESRNRKDALARERAAEGWEIVRPIVEWSAAQVVDYVRSRGVELNPLYRQGMKRVGCMPCVNCVKDELLEISKRYPEHIDKIREWERLVSEASRRGITTFFTDKLRPGETEAEIFERLRIDSRVQWAATERGGRRGSLLRMLPGPECSSVYGLCE